jgi:stage V sporulation protein B
VFAERIAIAVENPLAAPCIRAIAPALLCVCISSAVRGYFQGLCKMLPTALSQLIEALGKLFLGVLFAKWAVGEGYSVSDAAAFGILGLSVGTLLSALYLMILKLFYDKKEKRDFEDVLDETILEKPRSSLFELVRIAVPITLSSAVMGVTRITDMALIMRRLQDIGYSAAGANIVYGAYTTLAVPIFSLLPSLITPLALAVVPRLAAEKEQRSSKAAENIISVAIRVSVFFSMPASFAIAVYSRQILDILFFGEGEAISVAAPLLAILGASVLFSCLITTTNAILQAYGHTVIPMVSMSIGALLKMLSAYLLIGVKEIGAYGAPISTLICDATISAINFYFINKYATEKLSVSGLYFKPLCSSAIMISISIAAYALSLKAFENEFFCFVIGGLVGGISYVFFSLLLGGVEREDIEALPFGNKLIEILIRLKIGNFEKI